MNVARLIAVFCTVGILHGAGTELRFALHGEPKTFDPLLVSDEPSETVRYLTAGVLIRLNRKTQLLEPELATAWKVSKDGRTISFTLRQKVLFSSGKPFSSADVAFTFNRLMDPALHSPIGDSFRSASGPVRCQADGPERIQITFPAPIGGLERLFDQVSILSASAPRPESAVLGAFYMHEYKPGSYVNLRKNPHYWKRDKRGVQLPYLDAVRLDIQQNTQTEALRFQRGEFHLINRLDSELYTRLAALSAVTLRDAGPSLETEQLWFNQTSSAPIAAYKRNWFRSTNFRRAIADAVNRQDMARIVFHGRALPAAGMISPANRFWINSALPEPASDPKKALARLAQDGFRLDGRVLRDREGQEVEFSIITNAGNKARERMAVMIQHDLSTIGIRVRVVPLDFASLIERITRTFAYDACLLGLINVDLDPNAQMNVWLSSAANHQWNPNQKTPSTEWEAEIDRLMRAQASELEPKGRKRHFDRVQQIVADQSPFIYLIYKHSLSAVAPAVLNAEPALLWPETFWNVEHLKLAGSSR